MPAREYVCGKCDTKTEVLATMAAKEAGLKPSSPICGNKKMLPPFGGPSCCGSRYGPGCCG